MQSIKTHILDLLLYALNRLTMNLIKLRQTLTRELDECFIGKAGVMFRTCSRGQCVTPQDVFVS